MTQHQFDSDAKELWNYFNTVIEWGKAVFPTYRTSIKGRNWGGMYDCFRDHDLSPEEQIVELMKDDYVTSKQGIY